MSVAASSRVGDAGRQSAAVLLRALTERHPALGEHVDGVTEMAEGVARRLGLEGA